MDMSISLLFNCKNRQSLCVLSVKFYFAWSTLLDTSLKEADNGTMISGINLSFSSSILINITVDPSTGILKLLQVLDVVNKGGYTFMLALPKEIHVTDVTYVLEGAQKKFCFPASGCECSTHNYWGGQEIKNQM